MNPTKISTGEPGELLIQWNDGHAGRHALRTLRKYCPCSACKQAMEQGEEQTLLPILTPGQNELASVEPIGNYALQMQWKDGHKTGIYTFDYLRQICECSECLKTTGE